MDCSATFQLFNEKNNEHFQQNDDILNDLLTSEKVEDDDVEKETVSADEYAFKFKKTICLSIGKLIRMLIFTIVN